MVRLGLDLRQTGDLHRRSQKDCVKHFFPRVLGKLPSFGQSAHQIRKAKHLVEIRLTGTGLAIGLVCSVGASLLMRSLLFAVQPWDAVTLGCMVALLGLASMAASFLPARRAASVNPTDALRAE
jgi:ABC-type lipoprotein release transport system permease subunit